MKKTKIEWCDATWNPVTGCRHGCTYCYARSIAKRFGSHQMPIFRDYPILHEPVRCTDTYEYMRIEGISAGKIQPYPFDFTPTFHRYRLDEPRTWTKPRNIFVCSMGDLCGEWVPQPWKQDVIAACKAAPQHRYLFLTKNPYGYNVWPSKDRRIEHEFDQENFWLGCSMTGHEDLSRYWGHYGRYLYAMNGNMIPGKAHRFISIEPILTDVTELSGYEGSASALREAIASRYAGHIEWVIIGAETGNRKGKVVPERRWIEKIVKLCDKAKKPVFMKESLRGIMGEDFRQEFPWEVST